MIVSILFGIVISSMVLGRISKLRKNTLKTIYNFTQDDETPTLSQLVEFSQKHPVQYELTES